MKNKKLKVAVTGNIGSGKSTFTSALAKLGYPVINADKESKRFLLNDDSIKHKIISQFGAEAYKGKNINSVFMANNVFSNKKKLKIINSILHPPVIKLIESKINEFHKKFDIVFCESALVFEAGIKNLFDYVVLISADYKTRETRTKSRLKLSTEQFKMRNNNQLSDDKTRQEADFVFTNNGSKKELVEKAELLIFMLNKIIHKTDN